MVKISHLSNEQVDRIKQNTPFDDKDLQNIMKRYCVYDKSKEGRDGIPGTVVSAFPELRLNPFTARIVDLYIEAEQKRIYPEKFVYMVAALDPRMDIQHKRKLAFRCLDVHDEGRLRHDEVYRLYTLLYRTALTNDQILDLTFRALELPDLTNPGEILFDDMQQLVSDAEIRAKFTVNLQTTNVK